MKDLRNITQLALMAVFTVFYYMGGVLSNKTNMQDKIKK